MTAKAAFAAVAFAALITLQLNTAHAEGEVTSPFGWRIHPVTGVASFHSGVDLAYEEGTPIAPLTGGIVVFAGSWGNYGNCVIVEHENGDCTLYGHLSAILAEEDATVDNHTALGLVGSTGLSTGPHLHLEWWHDGYYCDPAEFVE